MALAVASVLIMRPGPGPADAQSFTWKSMGIGGLQVSGLIVDQSAQGIVYASGDVAPAYGRTGLLKTVDAGRTWMALDRGLPVGFRPRVLAVSPSGGRVVLAAGVDGVYRSDSSGAWWRPVRLPVPPVTAILFDAANPRVVLAGTELAGNLRSTDAGLSWRPANAGLPRDRYGTIPGAVVFAQDPVDPKVIYMGTNGFAGVYRSDTGGLSWSAAGNKLPSTAVLDIAVSPIQPGPVVVATEKGASISNDKGATWQALPALAAVSPVAIEFEPNSSSVIYAAGARGTVHRTTNAGASWVELTSLPRPLRDLAVWSSSTTSYLAAAAAEGVWQLQLRPTLPASPEPPTRTRAYFTETGHNISPTFYPAFLALGALDRFGLPRTEEFTEDGMVVQYFQRGRLEFHPQRKGTPYEVQVTLMGEWLLGPERLPRAEPFESSAEQRYVPETGHGVSYAFLRYFNSRGGLDSLGYPVSEELLEGGRPVQYFQRARLEYRAELAGTRDEVQLGLIGDEVLRQRGWLD